VTILVIEDNTLLRQGFSRMLTGAGATVVSTRRIATARGHLDAGVDFVLSDYVLEGESYKGDYFVKLATEQGVPAALMSAGLVDRKVRESVPIFLPKPVDSQTLIDLIYEHTRTHARG